MPRAKRTIARVQTGVRMEKRLLLVLKALAGTLDLSLGDLPEGVVLHAFDGAASRSAVRSQNASSSSTAFVSMTAFVIRSGFQLWRRFSFPQSR